MNKGERSRNNQGAWQSAHGESSGEISRREFMSESARISGAAVAAGLLASPFGELALAAKKGGDLVIAQGGDVSKLDPYLSTSVHDITVSFNIYDNLITRRRDGKLHPSLATEWKPVSSLSWQFKLRKDAKFHNGDLLTAEDIKFSIERTYTDPKSMVKTVLTTVDRIETPDPYTVIFWTKAADPLLPDRLAFYGGQIIPAQYFQKVGPDEFNAKPVGSGPVKVVEWVKDDRLVLEAFKEYWGGPIDVQRVIYKPIPEVAARVASILKGETDIITKLPPDHVERVNKSGNARAEGVLYAGLYVLGVNSKHPPLDNKLVKQALSLAIDRNAIVKDLWRGQGSVPNGPIAKGDFAYDTELPPFKFDPAKAKSLLKQAGYKGEEVALESTVGYVANDKQMSEAIVTMWRDAGINAKMEIIEYSVRAQKNRDKSFKGLWWSDPTSVYADPDGMMWRLLGPGGIMDYWREPRFDQLGQEARFSLDKKFRLNAYREMTKIFLEYLPWLPIIQPIESYGVQKKVDWKPYSNQQLELRNFNLKIKG